MNRYDDDDNRTIADMSGVDNRGFLTQWMGILDPTTRAAHGPRKSASDPRSGQSHAQGTHGYSEYGVELTKEERWALIKYTMKYALGMGLVFIAAFGLLILLMVKLWK